MKQEDKQFLIKDLCARLPYGVKFEHGRGIDILWGIVDDLVNPTNEHFYFVENIKPYLFPMYSMTERQRIEYYATCYGEYEKREVILCREVDWLNKHHFDYHGLIDKGLALDATGLNIY